MRPPSLFDASILHLIVLSYLLTTQSHGSLVNASSFGQSIDSSFDSSSCFRHSSSRSQGGTLAPGKRLAIYLAGVSIEGCEIIENMMHPERGRGGIIGCKMGVYRDSLCPL